MTRTTHATVGVCSSFYFSTIIGVNPVWAVIVGVLSSLLADIDTGKSLINKLLIRAKCFRNKWMKLYYLILTFALYAVYCYTGIMVIGLLSALCLLLVIGEHRTWFHSLLMVVPFTFIMLVLNLRSELVAIGVLNYTLHLILDTPNPSGVMLFYPISKKVFRLPITFRSNSAITRFLEYSADLTLLYLTFEPYLLGFVHELQS